MKYGPDAQKTLTGSGTIGKRAEQAGSKPLRVVRGNQHQVKHHTPSHGQGGMAGTPKPAQAKAQKPATMGGQDHTAGRRRGQGY